MSDREAPDVALLARTARGESEALGELARRHAPSLLRLARAEESELLARAVASLSPADAEVLLLRDIEGLSGEEAARALELELPALKSRLHRARLRLLGEVRMRQATLSESEREVGGLRCRDVLARLSDYLDAELPASERAAVEAHLRGCSVCERFGGRFVETLRATREALGAAPTIDEALLARIRKRIESAT